MTDPLRKAAARMRPGSLASGLGLVLLAAVSYFAGVRLSVAFVPMMPAGGTWDWWVPVWISTGLAVALVFRFGWQVVPGLVIGSLASEIHMGTPVLIGLAIAILNGTQPLVLQHLMGRRHDPAHMFARVGPVFRFIYATAVSTGLYSVFFGSLVLHLSGRTGFDGPSLLWVRWMLGDLSAIFLVTPILTLMLFRQVDTRHVIEPESIAVFLVAGLVTAGLFATDGIALPVGFVLFPIVVWAALRRNAFVVSMTVLLITVIATVLTAMGHGPFIAVAQANYAILPLQYLIAALALTGLLLCSATAERNRLQSELADMLTRLDGEVGERTRELAETNRHLNAEIAAHERATRVIEGRNRIMQKLARGSALDELLQDLAQEVTAFRDRWTVRIALADPRGHARVAAIGGEGAHRETLRRDIDVYGAGRVFLNTAIMAGPDHRLGTLSILLEPGTPFTEEDRVFLAETADLASVLIEHREREERLRTLVRYDSLTGVFNRTAFEEALQEMMGEAAREKEKVYVLYLDLDGFKAVNDTFGHDAGDRLLVEAASRVSTAAGTHACVGRFGGDEFVVAMSAVERVDVEATARAIIRSCHIDDAVPGSATNVSASIGISAYPGDATTVEAMVRSADTAMYVAKRVGGSCYAFSGERAGGLHARVWGEMRAPHSASVLSSQVG
ncbi:sensor domain-containing diguanylate cyclase [Pararhizobium mangrovi]|uniref:Diguanylate cyclase n=1 Tax=Pararhizobium mangrovi TaxID=2590452 RepID=A0A506UHT5_9HYPH|nr:diguanylate cyclase [Pararhizobium mangrovi]TPW32876.1 diguanylate cyclase [Pararhizobium mangrovi]